MGALYDSLGLVMNPALQMKPVQKPIALKDKVYGEMAELIASAVGTRGHYEDEIVGIYAGKYLSGALSYSLHFNWRRLPEDEGGGKELIDIQVGYTKFVLQDENSVVLPCEFDEDALLELVMQKANNQ